MWGPSGPAASAASAAAVAPSQPSDAQAAPMALGTPGQPANDAAAGSDTTSAENYIGPDGMRIGPTVERAKALGLMTQEATSAPANDTGQTPVPTLLYGEGLGVFAPPGGEPSLAQFFPETGVGPAVKVPDSKREFIKAIYEAVAPYLDDLSTVRDSVNQFQEKHPVLAKAGEYGAIGLSFAAGGPVKKIISMLASEAVEKAYGADIAQIKGQILDDVGAYIAEQTGADQDTIARQLDGLAFGIEAASMVLGMKSDVLGAAKHGRHVFEINSGKGDNVANVGANAATNLTRPVSSPHYSVVNEVQLRPGTYTASDANHFRQANRQLYEMMQENPSLASSLESQYPGITSHVTPGPRGGVADTSPPGLTWHHDPNIPGQLQLVPRIHHQAPGPVQNTLHPQQQGGREIWGGGR